jgi:hypothetical protein
MSIFRLVAFDANRFMILETRGLGPLGPLVVTYQSIPSERAARFPAGSTRTRLIARLRMTAPGHLGGQLAWRALAFGDWIMMRKQFLTLKKLSEMSNASGNRSDELG